MEMGKFASGLELNQSRNCGSTSAPGLLKLKKNSHNLLNVKTIVETSAKKRRTRFPKPELLLVANYFISIFETTIFPH